MISHIHHLFFLCLSRPCADPTSMFHSVVLTSFGFCRFYALPKLWYRPPVALLPPLVSAEHNAVCFLTLHPRPSACLHQTATLLFVIFMYASRTSCVVMLSFRRICLDIKNLVSLNPLLLILELMPAHICRSGRVYLIDQISTVLGNCPPDCK